MAGELTPEEREARRGGLGGSDAGPVFGYGYQTPFGVWCSKVYGSEQTVTPMMQRGHDLEPVVADLFSRKTGDQAYPAVGQEWSSDPATPWLFATVDYRLDTPGTWLECKTADWYRVKSEWGPDGSGPDGIPPAYLLQAHHQIAATEVDRVIVAVLFVDEWELRHYVVERDDTIRELLVEGERQFWETYVVERVPPPITHPAKDLAAARSIPVTGGPVDLDASAREHLVAWAESNRAATAAKKLGDEAKAELVRLIGEGDGATLDGIEAVSASYNKRGGRTYRLLNKREWST